MDIISYSKAANIEKELANETGIFREFERGNFYIPSSYKLGYLGSDGEIITDDSTASQRATFDEYIQIKYPCTLYVHDNYAGTLCTYNSNKEMLTRTNVGKGGWIHIPENTIFRFTLRGDPAFVITDVNDFAKHCYLDGAPSLMPGLMYTIASNNYSRYFSNANLAPVDRSFFISSNITNAMISNLPEYGYYGILITFSAIRSDVHGRIQVFANKNGGKLWYRVESGSGSTYSYTVWNLVATGTDVTSIKNTIKENEYDFLRCFHKFCGIGDSLMAGFTSINGTTVSSATALAAGNNWFQYLCTRLNRDGTNLAVGSSTTHNWRYGSQTGYPSTNLSDADIDGVDCYFVGLGVNDFTHPNENTIGTSADINASDYTQNADSTYGNLDFILHKLAEYNPYAKVFVFTIPWYGEYDPSTINTAISYVCSVNSNAYCIDLAAIYDTLDTEFVEANHTGGHFNPITYNYFSTVIENAVNKYIHDNYSQFVWIPYEH